jgi:hypothetical protein
MDGYPSAFLRLGWMSLESELRIVTSQAINSLYNALRYLDEHRAIDLSVTKREISVCIGVAW